MNKRIFYFAAILLLFLSSCFEIVEEINFNEDGSGHINLTFNLSKSKTKLKSIMLLDSVNGYSVPSKDEIKKEISKVVSKIKLTKGISDVKSSLNFDDYIFKITCAFTDIDALNKVISNFSSPKDAMAIQKHKHFKYDREKGTFIRSHHLNLSKEFNKTKMEDREVFETATFTSIYRFENIILTSQNNNAKISSSKKAIMFRANAQDIIKGRKSIKNQITIQK